MKGKICSIEGCDKKHSAKGFCDNHYQLWARRGRLADWDGSDIRPPSNIWTDTERRCSNCGEFKPFDQFHKNNGQRKGINNTCKVCASVPYGESVLAVETIIRYMTSKKHHDAISIEAGPMDTPCHIWQRSKTRHGYGQKGLSGRNTRVHRLALVTRLGRHIAEGMTASHLCHNPSCCNPRHIVEESIADNLGRSKRDRQAEKLENVLDLIFAGAAA